MLVKSYELAYNVSKKKTMVTMKFSEYNNTSLDFVIKLTKDLKSVIDLRGAKVTLGVIKPDNSVEIQQFDIYNVDAYIPLKASLKDLAGIYKGYLVIQIKNDTYTIGPMGYQVIKRHTLSQLCNNIVDDTSLRLFRDIITKLKPLTLPGYPEAYDVLLRSFDSMLITPNAPVGVPNSDIANESTRQAFELSRQSAEVLRESNEALRKVNERERIQNESLRQHNENLRQIAYEKYIAALEVINYEFNNVYTAMQDQMNELIETTLTSITTLQSDLETTKENTILLNNIIDDIING